MFLKAFPWPPLCRVNLLVNEKWLEIRRRARRFLSTPNGEILGLAVGASFLANGATSLIYFCGCRAGCMPSESFVFEDGRHEFLGLCLNCLSNG